MLSRSGERRGSRRSACCVHSSSEALYFPSVGVGGCHGLRPVFSTPLWPQPQHPDPALRSLHSASPSPFTAVQIVLVVLDQSDLLTSCPSLSPPQPSPMTIWLSFIAMPASARPSAFLRPKERKERKKKGVGTNSRLRASMSDEQSLLVEGIPRLQQRLDVLER